MAWLEGWSYRKSVTLSRAAGEVTNYQMKLLLGESAGAIGEDVDCGGLCLSTFNDIRFTASDGTTLLDYWIESISGTTPNQLATIWIEFDTIGTGNTTFYMYYGNAAAPAVSSGADTFPFFDHFDGDLSLWTTNYGTPSIASSIVTFNGTQYERITTTATYGTNYAFRALVGMDAANAGGISFDEHHTLANFPDGTQKFSLRTYRTDWGDGTLTDISNKIDGSHILEIRRNSTTGVIAALDDNVVATHTTNFVTVDAGGRIGLNATNGTFTSDWALIRQCLAIEPVWGAWGEGFSVIISVSAPAALLLTAHPVQIFPIMPPAAALTLTPHDPSYGQLVTVGNTPALVLMPYAPGALMAAFPPVAALVMTPRSPSYIWEIPANQRPAAQIIYTCTLTGDGEVPALTDLDLPMSSFQGRMRDGEASYLSCVIPNATDYEAGITARQNGDIVVKQGYKFSDGTTQLEEIARVDFETLAIDKGARSASATIVGHRTTTSSTVKEITVEGVSYYALQADTKRRIRATFNTFLRIGDACIYGTAAADRLTVGYISYAVDTTQAIMEVTEA